MKSILKKTIFEKLDEVEKQHKRNLKKDFGENLKSFENFKENLENIITKINGYNKSKDQHNIDHIAAYLEIDNIHKRSKNLFRLDEIFKSTSSRFTELKFDATLNLGNIKSLIDFKCKEFIEQDAKNCMKMITDRSVGKFKFFQSSQKTQSEENCHECTDSKDNNGKKNQFKKNKNKCLKIQIFCIFRRQINSEDLINLMKKPKMDLEEPTMTLVWRESNGSRASMFNSTPTEKAYSRGKQTYSTPENNKIVRLQQANRVSEYDNDFVTNDSIKKMDSFLTYKFINNNDSCRNLIKKTEIYSINDQSALISSQTITEQPMYKIINQITEEEPRVTNLLFCRNLFTFDPISFLTKYNQKKLPRTITIDIGNNRFTKDRIVLRSEIYGLERKNKIMKN